MRSRTSRLRVSAAAAAAMWVAGSTDATTRYVNSCADSGPGTLRDQIAAAVAAFGDGDTIDLSTQLTSCSVITLLSQISFNVDLLLLGPPTRTVTITGAGSSRLLQHTGSGMTLQNLTLTNGYFYSKFGDAAGGCVWSTGNVSVVNSTVSGCTAYTLGGTAFGGGIYSKTGVNLDHASITANTAHSVTFKALGGGIGVLGDAVLSQYSTISGNTAISDSASYTSRGGGIYASGRPSGTLSASGSSLYQSCIDSNAAKAGAGIYVYGTRYDHVAIRNSTISRNVATGQGGGVSVSAGYLVVKNSTVAFNAAQTSAGIYVSAAYSPMFEVSGTTISSSIAARNIDSGGGFTDVFVRGSWTVTDSLMNSYNAAPANGTATIVHGDPELAPLGYHGGPTRVHALLATSPAIDQGSNTLSLVSDQRGPGYAREVPSGKPDIGAYERQVNDDELYYSGFE